MWYPTTDLRLTVLVSLLCPLLSHAQPITGSSASNQTLVVPEIINATTTGLSEQSRPQCWSPRTPMPPDFNCHATYHRFLRDLGVPKEEYVISKTWLPVMYQYIRVPRSWSDGSCKLTVDLENMGPMISLEVDQMMPMIEAILRECIQDEKTSAGGTVTYSFTGNVPLIDNKLIFDFRRVAPVADNSRIDTSNPSSVEGGVWDRFYKQPVKGMTINGAS